MNIGSIRMLHYLEYLANHIFFWNITIFNDKGIDLSKKICTDRSKNCVIIR